MDEEFRITERSVGTMPVVEVVGEIDIATAPELRDRLAGVGDGGGGPVTVVVDLLGVRFLDSTALGVLVGALKRYRGAGGDMRLVIGEARIRKVFEITGLVDVFAIFDSVDAAVAA